MATASKVSEILEIWAKTGRPKTVGELIHAFPDQGRAAVICLLMLSPATPLPTGGVTHVLEIIAMLVALQIIGNSKTLWLPKRLKQVRLSNQAISRLSRVVTKIYRLEARLGFRSPPLFSQWPKRFAGSVLLIFIIAAFVAPPFSGIDTLPAIGAVMISIGLIAESLLVVAIGLVIGCAGIGLEITIGKLVYRWLF